MFTLDFKTESRQSLKLTPKQAADMLSEHLVGFLVAAKEQGFKECREQIKKAVEVMIKEKEGSLHDNTPHSILMQVNGIIMGMRMVIKMLDSAINDIPTESDIQPTLFSKEEINQCQTVNQPNSK